MFTNLALKLVFFSIVNPLLRFIETERSSDDLDLERQQQLLVEFKDNKEVFAEIYNQYYEIIFRFLLKRTMSSEAAYDLTADTFEKAFSAFSKFKWQGFSIKVWLFRIAINCLKNYRRNLSKTVSPLDQIPEGLAELAVDAKEELKLLNEALFSDNELAKLSDAIETLSPKYKEIISLYYFSDMSQKEIALATKKSVSAVKAMMHRAIENLRTVLDPNLI